MLKFYVRYVGFVLGEKEKYSMTFSMQLAFQESMMTLSISGTRKMIVSLKLNTDTYYRCQ